MIYVVVGVPCVGSYVYVVRPATGGTHKTLNRASLLPARPPAIELDKYAQKTACQTMTLFCLCRNSHSCGSAGPRRSGVTTEQACHLVVVVISWITQSFVVRRGQRGIGCNGVYRAYIV